MALTASAPPSAAYSVDPSGDSVTPLTPVCPLIVATVLPEKLVTRMEFSLALPWLKKRWSFVLSTAISK